MRTILANNAAPTQGCQEVGGAVEVRQLDVRGADTLGVVRIGANTRRKVKLCCKVNRRDVVLLVGDLRVEDLDDIQITLSGERLQDRPTQSRAFRVEGMRRVDQSTLRAYAVHDLSHGQHVRDSLREEQSDQFARRGPNLFAHDHPNSQVAPKRGFGSLDGMVVRDAHNVKSSRFHTLDELIQSGTRVAGCARMHMTVKANEAGGSGWWWPGRTQQQGGD